SLRLSA
ncbi:hypothetical protein CP061683_0988B, partial [Chlamydia psittaci 06-1683]